MSAEEIVSLLCTWLVTSCGLLTNDGKNLAKNLVHVHKVTSLSSLGDMLKASPDFLTKSCDIRMAYNIQILKRLRQHLGKDLETLTSVEVSTVLFNASFSPPFCREILRCGISGFILTTVPIEDIMKQCSAATANVSTAVLSSVVSRLQTQGVPSFMLTTMDRSSLATTEQSNLLSGSPPIPVLSAHNAIVSSVSEGSAECAVVSYSSPPLGSARKRPLAADDNTQRQTKRQSNSSFLSPIKPVPRTAPASDSSDSILLRADGVSVGGEIEPTSQQTSEGGDGDEQNIATVVQLLIAIKPEVADVEDDTVDEGSNGPPLRAVVSPTGGTDRQSSAVAVESEMGAGEVLKMAFSWPRVAPSVAASTTSHRVGAADQKTSTADATKVGEKIQTSNTARPVVKRINLSCRGRAAASGEARAVSRAESNASREDSAACGVLQDLTVCVLGIDPREQTKALKAFIKMFPAISIPQLRRAQEFGLVKRIVDLIRIESTNETVLLLCVTALSHVLTSKEQRVREYVFQLGASRLLVNKIRCPSTPPNVKEPCMWMAGHFACTEEHREGLVAEGIIATIAETYDKNSPSTLQFQTVQTICNLLRTRPALSVTQIRPLLPIIAHNLRGGECRGVADAMAALYFITLEEGDEYVGEVFTLPGVVRKVVQLAGSDSVVVCVAAEKVIENLSAGSMEQTKQLMAFNILPGVLALVSTDQKKHRHRMIAACRTVRNLLCDGDEDVVGQVVAAGLIEALVALAPFELEEVNQLATLAVCYAVQAATDQQVTSIVAAGALSLLARYLQEFADTDTTVEVLGTLEIILVKSENISHFDSVIRAVYDLKGWLDVDSLREDPSPLVSDAAKKINIQRLRDAYLARQKAGK